MGEYRQMFSLTDQELDQKILGCADGPASVNAELHQRGKEYVSMDPIYQFSAQQIRERIEATTQVIAEQLEKNRADYRWDYYQFPDQLVRTRQAAMNTFLTDFEQHSDTKRYVFGALPQLPFEDNSFDLVLCSYCLFSYSSQLDEEFHCQAILEMARVAQEVRIFPLLEINGKRSRHLDGVLSFLKEKNLFRKIVSVDYEFQTGGNQLLILKTP